VYCTNIAVIAGLYFVFSVGVSEKAENQNKVKEQSHKSLKNDVKVKD